MQGLRENEFREAAVLQTKAPTTPPKRDERATKLTTCKSVQNQYEVHGISPHTSYCSIKPLVSLATS